jgi:3-deoxy-D-manno-octulosonate 8-phosphate phosphatase (KDO 8-P phosphatase)
MVFEELRDLFQKVRLVIFDVDGVLTDGSLYYGPEGEAFKAFNAKDGLGIHQLVRSGIEVGIITGRVSSFVTKRAEDLGIRHVYQKKMDKKPVFFELCEKLALKPDQVAYMGDDIIDLPVLEEVAIRACPADAMHCVKKICNFIAHNNGGRGAARELCDCILEAQQCDI